MAETTANRAGLRDGQLSELTVIAPLREGGADRLRAVLAARKGALDGVVAVGSVHDMRWVFLENDTRLLFATTYDGDWDSYIDDFTTKIPELMDLLLNEVEGWPGIQDPTAKDVIAAHQVTAAAWYTAHPNLRVGDITRNANVAAAVENLLDSVNP